MAIESTLTLGPLLFNWPADKARDFYFRIADEAPVDVVYLGEVVCSKRQLFHAPYYPEVIERLRRAGKEVILSTLALVTSPRERESVRTLCGMAEDFLIEANDFSAFSLLKGRPLALGPYINIYNETALRFFEKNGVAIISPPVELSAVSLSVLAAAAKAPLEVQVFGRLPLAISARCYHARAHRRHKDGCLYVCGEDCDGMNVETLDHQPFLAINGTQTLSHTYCNLLHELKTLQDMRISRFRISPHDMDMVRICTVFREVLRQRLAPAEAEDILRNIAGGAVFSNGFFHHQQGIAYVREENVA